jgi:D-glycero-D-manno-heptose 1,7-bisphosphate phosphatase
MVTQGVILVGGKGARLQSLGLDCPKPLIEIAGRPFVEHVIAQFASFGVTEILLLAGHLGEQVRDRYDGATLCGARLKVLIEPAPRGAAGALAFAGAHLAERFLMANGDSILRCDLAEFVATPLREGAAGRLLLRRVADSSRYGTVAVAEDGTVLSFVEKNPDSSGPAPISAGVYVLDRAAILAAAGAGERSIETQVFPDWAARGMLESRTRDGYFIDIGLPESYDEARRDLAGALERPAAFLDRDGVVNVDRGYTYRPEDLKFTPTAVEAVRRLNGAGYFVVVVSNQAGVAKGHFGEADVQRFHAEIQRRLLAEGAHVDAFYYCPFHPDGTVPEYSIAHEDRKPGAGMLRRAMAELPIRIDGSFLVGDKDSDIEAAERAGLPGFLLRANDGDLAARVAAILASLPDAPPPAPPGSPS